MNTLEKENTILHETMRTKQSHRKNLHHITSQGFLDTVDNIAKDNRVKYLQYLQSQTPKASQNSMKLDVQLLDDIREERDKID